MPAAGSKSRCMASASPRSTRPKACCRSSAPPREGAVNIGMLHTSLGGSPVARPLRALPARRSARRGLRLLGARPHSSAVRGAGQGDDRDAGQSAGARHQRGRPEDRRRWSQSRDDRKIHDRGAADERCRVSSALASILRGVEDWREALKRIETALEPRAPRRRASIWSRGSSFAGATPLAWRLRSDADMLGEESRALRRARSARPGSTRSNSTAPRRSASGARRLERSGRRTARADGTARSRSRRRFRMRCAKSPRNCAANLPQDARDDLFGRDPGEFANILRARGARGRRGRARASARRRRGHRRVRIARLDLTRYGQFSDHATRLRRRRRRADPTSTSSTASTKRASRPPRRRSSISCSASRSSRPMARPEAQRPNWHAYNAMRIGARLELARRRLRGRAPQARQEQPRRRRRPAARRELLIKAELAGVDREAFRMMFSLDDESLEKGGEAILASRGDLGQLLFSASAGLAEISGRLDVPAQEGGRVLQAARLDNRACRKEARSSRR